jgi:hypothetical protein
MTSILRTSFSSTARQLSVRNLSISASRLSAESDLKKRAGSKIGPAREEFVKPIPKTSKLAQDVVNDAKSTVQIAANVARQAFETVTGTTSDNSGTTSIHNDENMSSSDEKPNASGLTPSESRKLPVRQPSQEDMPIMNAVKSVRLNTNLLVYLALY